MVGMPLNNAMIEDAWLGAAADFDRWRREWEAQFTEPLLLSQVRGLWVNLTPAQKQTLAQAVGPEMYQQIITMLEGGKNHAT